MSLGTGNFESEGASIAVDPAGDFLVAFSKYSGDGDINYEVLGRKFTVDEAGGEGSLGAQKTLASPESETSLDPVIAAVEDGDFIIAYSKSYDANLIYGKRFNTNFEQVGPEFLVNDYTGASSHRPAIAGCPDGSFVIAWDADKHDQSYQAVLAKQYVSHRPVVTTNDQLDINEGDTDVALDNNLEFTNPSGLLSEAYMNVTTLPSNGTLSLSGSPISVSDEISMSNIPDLTYTHDGEENTSDSFVFTVFNPDFSSADHTFSIDVTPVNDSPVLDTNDGLDITEGDTASLSGTLLVTDADNSADELVYTIDSEPSYGSLWNVEDTDFELGNTDTFTQEDINLGYIEYRNDGSHESHDSFTFSVTDGMIGGGGISYNIDIGLVDDEPVQINNVNGAVDEGATVTIDNSNIQYTDEESSASELIFEMTSGPSQGSLKLNGTDLSVGDTFTQDDIDQDKLTYEQDGSDPLGGSGSSNDQMEFSLTQDGDAMTSDEFVFDIDVTYSDDAPVIHTNDAGVLDEGSSLTVGSTLLDISDEEDSDTDLQIIIDDLPDHGTLSLDGTPLNVGDQFSNQDLIDNKVEYQNDGSENTTDSFEFTMLDISAGYPNNTFSFTINPINDNPTLDNPIADQSATEDIAFSYSIPSGTFSDAETASLTYSATLDDLSALPSWLDFTDDTFSGTPLDGDGDLTIIVTAEDEGGLTITDTFDLTVTAVNDNPTLDNPIADQSATEDIAFSYTLPSGTFSDEETASLTYSATLDDHSALPSWLDFTGDTFSGTPLEGDGDLTIIVTAEDEGGLTITDTFDLTVAAVNDNPTLDNPIADQSATEDIAFSYTLPSGTFSDEETVSLTYSATLDDHSALPSWLDFTGDTFSGTPLEGDGDLTIIVTAEDEGGLTITDTFDLTVTAVNDNPTLDNPIADQSATEDIAFSYTLPSGTFSDEETVSLTYSATLDDHSALPSWLDFTGDTFSGTPLEGDGDLTIIVTAEDEGGLTITDTFDLTVTAVNDNPTLDNPIADQSATEDIAFSYTLPSGTFSDEETASLTYSATLDDLSALPSWLDFTGDTFSGTPLDGDGDLTIIVTAEDEGGLTITDTFDLTVTAVNDNPTLDNAIADQSATEDIAFSYTLPSGTFSDEETASLTYSATLDDLSALPSWLDFTGDAFSGTPLEGDGDLTIIVTAEDEGGLTITDTFDLTVTAVNDNPTLDNPIADQSATEDIAFSYTLPSGTFSDEETASLTYSATLDDLSALPSWLDFTGDAFSGTPLEGDGDLTIIVTAEDEGGLTITDTFDLTVTAVNDNPTLDNPIADQSATEDIAFSYTLPSGTFSDEETASLTYSATLDDLSALPSWLDFTGDTFSGTPLEGDGDLTIIVTAEDEGGLTITDTFDLTVTAVNDNPTLDNPIADQSATEDIAFSYTLPSGTFSDEETASLTYSATLDDLSALPSWLDFTGDTFSGTPLESDGDLTIIVTAEDEGGLTITDTFELTINAVNDDPTLDNPIADQSATEDVAFSFTIPSDTFSDEESSTLTLTATLDDLSALPSWLDFSGDTFSGTPLEGDGDLIIVVTAADDDGLTVSDSFDLLITPINDGPAVANALVDQSTDLFQPYSFVIPENTFFDEESDEITLTASLEDDSALPDWLSFDAATGVLSGTPMTFFGDLEIKITGTTSDGESASSSFILTVNYVLADENDINVKVEMYPNPVGDILKIDMENELTGRYDIQFFDKTGRLVKNAPILKTSTTQSFELNVSGLNRGFYIVRISKEDTTATFKINKI